MHVAIVDEELPYPHSVASHRSASLDRAIRDLAARDRIDLWQAEWTPYAASLPDPKKTRRLIMAHNAESKIWKRYWDRASAHSRKFW